MRRSIICFVMILFSFSAFALEVDEKLTTRVLRISKSKKTLLLNRGLEDGIAVGDHAKFFLTTGVIGRGVVVKASPTRSIWAVYRVVNSDQFEQDKVLNLKIATPVKVTEDPTKMIAIDSIATGQGEDTVNIALAPGADDTSKELTSEEQRDLRGMRGGPVSSNDIATGINEENWELWGLINFNGLSVQNDRGTSGSNSGSVSNTDFTLGMEWYFRTRPAWFQDFSIMFPIMHLSSTEVQNIDGTTTGVSAFEYGLGLNYHFLADPLSQGEMIGFATLSFGIGATKDKVSPNGIQDPTVQSGNSNFFAFGLGMKYITRYGLGFRTILDLYRRTETFSFEDGSDFSKTVSGPRVQMGLSYRW